MTLVDAGLAALVGTMVAVVVGGTVAGARRASLPAAEVRRLGTGLAVTLIAWLGLTAALAGAGVLSRWDSVPPRIPLLPLTVLASMLVLSRTARFGRLLGAIPPAWPIGLQTFRAVVEVLLWGLFLEGRIPERMTFAGSNVDVVVGVSAPLLAGWMALGRPPRAVVAAWNALGLGLLANIVTIALRSAPGAMNAGWGGVPNTAIAEVPFVWLPAFLVPLAVFGHVASLRQLATARRNATEPRPERATTS
jgi:drug/metabolite transporter superfamily protein YnfA